MIIHSFLTDGFMGWGEIFLESFKKHHGEDTLIVLDTRDLKTSQIDKLKNIYSNIEISNKMINLKKLAIRANVTESDIKKFKNAVENSSVTTTNKIWKLFISVEERYKDSIWRAFNKYKDTEDFMIHMDIDIYFRANIQKVFDFVKNYDVSIRFREKAIKKGRENRCVLGNFISFGMNENVENFLRTWHTIIDSVELKRKPKGFGQTSFWRAYKKHKKDLKWGNLPSDLKVKNTAKKAYMWSANRGTKKQSLKICWKDMKGE